MKAKSIIDAAEKNERTYALRMRDARNTLASLSDRKSLLQRDVIGQLGVIADAQLDSNLPGLSGEFGRLIDERMRKREEKTASLNRIESVIPALIAEQSSTASGLEEAQRRVRDQLGHDPKVPEFTREHAAIGLKLSDADEIRVECDTKLAAFVESSRYMYLRRAGFGTPEYQRNSLVRALDSWIARQCNFKQNRESEQMLGAMKIECESAMYRLADQKISIESKLNGLREDAERDYNVASLRAAAESAASLLAAKKAEAKELVKELSLFASNEDGYYIGVRKALVDALGGKKIEDLAKIAVSTSTERDDFAVEKISQLMAELRNVDSAMAAARESLNVATGEHDRAKSLEREVRRSVKTGSSYRYDSGLDMGSLLTGYMMGSIDLGDVARGIDEHVTKIPDEPSYYDSGSSSYGGGSSGWGSSDSFSSSSSFGGGSSDSFSTSDSF